MKKWLFSVLVGFIRFMPHGIARWFGRCLGVLVYLVDVKHRRIVFANLRRAFLGQHDLETVKKLAYQFHVQFVENIIEIIRLPLVSDEGYEKYVDLQGKEHIQAALNKGRGCIFLSMHSGNWELSNLVGSMQGAPYNMVANRLSKKKSIFEEFLIECRTSAGCKIIYPGLGGREIIRCLKNNEIVTLVADQGGRDGALVDFFGRKASMSTGAVRLALKYDVPILLVDMARQENGKHRLQVAPYELQRTEDNEADVVSNLQAIIDWHAEQIVDHPQEYMWQYRIWKNTDQKSVLILHDGRVGHLRQSEAMVTYLERALSERNISLNVHQVEIEYQSSWAAALFKLRGLAPKWLLMAEKAGLLRRVLTSSCADQLMNQVHADFVISCGSSSAPINHLLGSYYQARTIAILTPGLLNIDAFDTVIMPEHDRPKHFYRYRYLYFTQAAPNLINRDYLADHVKQLETQFSHLKNSVRTRIGVLIGGNTKGVVFTEHQARIVAHQIVQAAEELNAELLVTTSRRTPKSVARVFQKEFKESQRCGLFIQADKQDVASAVGGILGLSDVLVVSGESISMVSEAVSSGKKVVVYPVGDTERFGRMNKYRRFVQLLDENGYLASAPSTQITKTVLDFGKSKIKPRRLTDEYTLLRAMRILI